MVTSRRIRRCGGARALRTVPGPRLPVRCPAGRADAAARLGLAAAQRGPGRPRHRRPGVPGHHHPGLRPVPVRGRRRHTRSRDTGRPAPAARRGRLPGPAGLAARRTGHQPRHVRPRPARHRQVHPGQTPGHRQRGDRRHRAHPRRHQTRLHPAHRAPRRPGHPHRPGPGPDQPPRQRAARPGAAPHVRPRRRRPAVGSTQPAAVPADGVVHAGPRRAHQQRRGSHPRPRHRPAR